MGGSCLLYVPLRRLVRLSLGVHVSLASAVHVGLNRAAEAFILGHGNPHLTPDISLQHGYWVSEIRRKGSGAYWVPAGSGPRCHFSAFPWTSISRPKSDSRRRCKLSCLGRMCMMYRDGQNYLEASSESIYYSGCSSVLYFTGHITKVVSPRNEAQHCFSNFLLKYNLHSMKQS